MFIASTKNGKVYREGKDNLTWRDIPKEEKITQLQLTYPFKVKFDKAQGEKKYAPLVTLGKFDQYYFSNEATVKMLVQGDKPLSAGKEILEAKRVGGIDKKLGLVIEIRLDRSGNCRVDRYPLKTLKTKIKNGTFSGDVLRDGA